MNRITSYHAKYFSYELTKRLPTDSLQKLAPVLIDAQVDMHPHQLDAALFAFRSPLSRGAVLADEVGLGKTIEAALVISQKWAERKRKILIIVPANLRKQWSQELLDKFFLESIIMETSSFRDAVREKKFNPFDQNKIIICSYQFARKQEDYVSAVDWDLVVIDEAHRLRNVYKPTNKIANSIKTSVSKAPKILLTATPLQNSLLELYGLVSVIDDHLFGDLSSFKSQYSRIGDPGNESLYDDLRQRLKPVCQRTLRRQVHEYILFTSRQAIVEEFYPTQEEQRLYELVSSYLQKPDLVALPKSQRSLMTLILRKLLASSTYAIAGTLEALATKLDAIKNSQPAQDKDDLSDYESVDNLKEDWVDFEDDDNQTEEQPQRMTPLELQVLDVELEQLKDFSKLAKSIRINSKGEKLFTALSKGFEEIKRLGARKKALIFTESLRTQKYLKEILEAREYKDQIVLFNGSNADPESNNIYRQWLTKHEGSDQISGSETADKRAALLDHFKNEATIMIATEAAAEGINLQFCSLVVNYDLPWNPQKIEQRIGRCHRYGQEHDVVVVNFLNKANEADQRVYALLDQKFKLFSGLFGASDEVLGAIESGVDFEKRIARIYQECKTAEEIRISFDALQSELDEKIRSEMVNAKKKLLENFDSEVQEKLRINIKESKAHISKYERLLWNITQYFLGEDADFADKEYSFMLRRNPFPELKIHHGPYRMAKNIEDAHIYRIHHPLAQAILERSKSLMLECKTIQFLYDRQQRIISALEPFLGKSGWLVATNITINSFEAEDIVILIGIVDGNESIDDEICQKLFELPGKESDPIAMPDDIAQMIQNKRNMKTETLIADNLERNGRFLDSEIDKLEQWAEDVKRGLENQLRDLDFEIRTLKGEARRIAILEQKLEKQKIIRDKERQRNEKRRALFEHQDEVDARKERLIEDIQKRLSQGVETKELFSVRWTLKDTS